tara:strand:+ start:6645 stop:7334 length:690 start_codon:yes stop_codon:yes gene_type:complete
MVNINVIAIDGTSSTGKSTIARRIADKLDFTYIDSGSMYRAVTYFCLKNKIISEYTLDLHKLNLSINNINIDFKINPENSLNEICLNNEFIDSKIRTMEIADHVSKIAKEKNIRNHILKIQHSLAEKANIVMDGRDIGTVVFPDAKFKFYLSASPELRAKRRFDEMKKNGVDVKYIEVLENLITRDNDDTTRVNSPLKIADDAIKIDTENLSLDELEKIILNILHKSLF